MKKIFVFLVLACFHTTLNCAEVKFHELRFSNRARCALDSRYPTDRVFLLINNMDIARSLYRLAKSRGEETTALTQNGIKTYRYSIIRLMHLIHKKIVNGDLPLLPVDSTLPATPIQFQKIMHSCRSDEACPLLNNYLATLWNEENPENLPKLNQNVFSRRNTDPSLECHYLKKFSALESQLLANKPTKEILLKIGNAAKNVSEYIESCDNFSALENIKVASFELALPIEHLSNWNEDGFDYWNSFKLYFSWAYRYSKEMEKFSGSFSYLFKSVDIEDSVLLSSSDCKSITPPQCESSFLNSNSIREFAKNDFKKKAPELDILSPIPDGALKGLINEPFGEVNKDILSIGQSATTDAWSDQLRENYSAAKLLMRKKLSAALTNLNLITKNIPVEKFSNQFNEKFKILKDNNTKNSLYYLCAEYAYTSDKELSFIKKNLAILKETTLLDQVNSTIINQSSRDLYQYFEKLSEDVNNFCKVLHQNTTWDKNFILDQSGFQTWYITKTSEKNIVSTFDLKRSESFKKSLPMLYYSNYKNSETLQNIICIDAIDCSRLVLKSIIDLYSATLYADTFWNLDHVIKSPELFNPYSERTACKTYDPWFKTKSTLFSFFTDVAQAGISLSYPGVVFAKAELRPKKLVSFNQLVKDGVIVYDQKFEPQKINAGLAMDFGKLLNIPCGVSISHDEKNNPFQYFLFKGIALRSCEKNERNTIEVNSNNDISKVPSTSRTICFVCALNFESMASLSARSMPVMSSGYFLTRAIYTLYKGFTDPQNIPHSWKVDPTMVLNALNNHGGDIPNECIYPLAHGQECTF